MFKAAFTRLCICFICCGCMQRIAPRVAVHPKQFNIQLPFETDKKGILVLTQWGSAKTEHKLYLDNHSPTWASNNIIKGNASIVKSKEFLYRTTTADGKTIQGDVYVCDSIRIGSVNFIQVPLYDISNESNAGKKDGAIGENIMSEAIWKIDFENHIITLASSIDSITGLQESDVLPAAFTSKGIEIEISFRNKIKEKFEFDLGYNGWLIMPAETFSLIAAGNKKTYTDSMRLSTPAGAVITNNIVVSDSIQIGETPYGVFMVNNSLVIEKLIGLGFFRNFQFIVIDYINKTLYVSKRKLYE